MLKYTRYSILMNVLSECIDYEDFAIALTNIYVYFWNFPLCHHTSDFVMHKKWA